VIKAKICIDNHKQLFYNINGYIKEN